MRAIRLRRLASWAFGYVPRLRFARDRANFGADLRVERGPLQEISRAQIRPGRARDRADRAAFRGRDRSLVRLVHLPVE